MTQIDRVTRNRTTLMMSCASLALATAALFPQPARAQQALGAFRGDITGVTGTVTRTPTSNTTETITVGSANATINWRPTDHQVGGGTINFLPSANTATFTSAEGVTDYTVLNRILPDDSSRGIALNGHIISTLQGTQATGGRIWFYSPGGILIGATAVIDVGSLLLTTNDVTSWSTTTNGFSANFVGADSSTSKIQVAKGAQINALQQNSYIAMVAPRIEQGGKVRVNGSAAYVAGEQLAMTMNQGLFDIQVDVGTSDANGVVHTGETGGPANASAADNHKIYMVAVPKNQALTMLLGGKVGFDDAASATVENGQIFLSAGYNVQGDTFVENQAASQAGSPDSNIQINGGAFTSDVDGRALGGIVVRPDGTDLSFAGDLKLLGRRLVEIAAEGGDAITVGGKLQAASYSDRSGETGSVSLLVDGAGSAITVAGTTELRADFFNLFTANTVSRNQAYHFSANAIPLAGTVTVQASNGGHLTLTGATDLGAEALQPNGVAASGGAILVLANSGGTIDFDTDVHIDATSFGGYPTNGVGGDATGGYAEMTADGGTIHVAGDATLFADGFGGGAGTSNPAYQGGNGFGGVSLLQALNDGTISIGGLTRVTADAVGGENAAGSGDADLSGAATAGRASVMVSSSGAISFGQTATVSASAFGGDNDSPTGSAGAGYGGTVQVLLDGGSISTDGGLALFADGTGGTGQNAGDGFGGSASLAVTGGEGLGSGGSLQAAGDLRIEASGQGGIGSNNAEGAGGNGGDGYAGDASLYVSPFQDAESTINLDLADVFVTNNGEGGSGGNGLTGGNGGNGFGYTVLGEGFSGEARIDLYAGTVTTGEMEVYSTARGGQGGSGTAGAGGNGGDAFGGLSSLNVQTDVTSSLASSYDRAFAGSGGAGTTTQGNGGSAEGGDATFDVANGGHFTGDVAVNTNAVGGNGDTGGDASGGSSALTVEGILTAGSIAITADATGGAGMAGGSGTGGTALLALVGGRVTASGDTQVTAIGFGGNGLSLASGAGGLGGNGFGGSPTINTYPTDESVPLEGDGPRVSFGSVMVNAKGEGGTGGTGATGGVGGTGAGGYSSLSLAGNDSMSVGQTMVYARGVGGDGGIGSNGRGGNGGTATGGSASLFVGSGSSLSGTTYEGSTNALGGAGGTGSAGRGDGGSAESGSDHAAIDGSVTFGGTADTHDGLIVTSYAMGGDGSAGGAATAGDSSIDVAGSLTVAGQVQATAQAGGGNGDSAGGMAEAGSASVDISGRLTSASLFVGNTATGGSGDVGGDAFGGHASLFVTGSLGVDTLSMSTLGTGGGGISQGGNAHGGAIDLDVTGGSATIGRLTTLDASGSAGNTSTGTGGSASGGVIDAQLREGGSFSGGDLNASANALGGNGNSAGTAQGGFISLIADSFTDDGVTKFDLGAVTLTANGMRGTGVAGGETYGAGGMIGLASFGSQFTVDALSIAANGTDDGGQVYLQNGPDSEGQAGSMTFGSVDAAANGGEFAGAIHLLAASGMTMDLGNAQLTADGGFSNGGIFLVAGDCGCTGEGDGSTAPQAGSIPGGIAATDLILTTTGNISVALTQGADVAVTNTLSGTAGGLITLSDDGTGGAIRAHEIDFTAINIIDNADLIADIIRLTTSGAMNLGDLSASDTLALTSGGDLSTGNLSAGNLLTLQSRGNIATGTLDANNVAVQADGNLTTSDITAENSLGLIALGSITTGALVGGDIDVAAGDALTTGNVTAQTGLKLGAVGNIVTGSLRGGEVAIDAGGDLTTGDVSASHGLMMKSGNDIATGTLDADTVLIDAGGNFSVGDVDGRTSASFTAGGLARFLGIVGSPTITVTSSDIDVADGASLGVFGLTNLLTLNAVSSGQPIIIGDDGSNGGAQGQYVLNEDGDLHAAQIVINAVANGNSAAPDVNVYDVLIEGSATQGGGTRQVTLNTDGSVFVNGLVGYTDAGNNDQLAINAGHAIEINTDTGGIQISDSAGALTGTLALNADNVWVGTGSLLSQLEEDFNFQGRDAVLLNGGGTNPDGFVRAGTVNVGVANSFFVQNSNTQELFGGIDTGDGGLSVTNTGNGPVTVIAYGRQTLADGTVITNQDFIGSVDTSGTGGFTDDSAVNGCALGASCGGTVDTPPDSPPGIDFASILGPIGDAGSPSDTEDQDSDESDDAEDDGSSLDPNLRLINTTPINRQYQIEEPVTSGGDVVVGNP